MNSASALLGWLTDPAAGTQIAVRDSVGGITYDELRQQVRATMAAMRAAGVRPGDRVALCLPKSVAALECILASLALGAAYVPLDHRAPIAYLQGLLTDICPKLTIAPPERVAALRAEAGAQQSFAVVTGRTGASLAMTGPARSVLPEPASPDGLATILYTSGSTGRPKGIMLSHANLACFTEWAGQTFALSPNDQVSSHAPFHFDLSVFDIFCTLAAHGTLHLPDEATLLFPGALRQWIDESGITVWYSVPTALMQLSARRALTGLGSPRLILFAGEVFPVPALRRLMLDLPRPAYVNLYGPTETNVCTWYRLPEPPGNDLDTVPIGQACGHYEVSVRDPEGRILPPWATGEICVAGPGTMLGYWRQPSLTAASRLLGRPDSYRTGDYGHIRGDGLLAFAGRRDQQVKSRGQRIELLTLEATLNAHPGISEAIVVAVPSSSGSELVAFAVPGQLPASDDEVLGFVAQRLPRAYLPHRIEWPRELPRTPNGKADRAALRDRAARGIGNPKDKARQCGL